jgi:hypothetical protein
LLNDPPLDALAVPSFSQSSAFNPQFEASFSRMTDGLAEPFAATALSASAWIKATLIEEAFVTSVYLGASTALQGWGAAYINSAVLERSTNGSSWTTIQTLSGFTNGSFQTISVNADCLYLRVRITSNYLAIGEFSLL